MVKNGTGITFSRRHWVFLKTLNIATVFQTRKENKTIPKIKTKQQQNAKKKHQTQKPTTYIIYHFERLIPIDTVYLCIYMLTEACKKTDLQIYAYKDCCPHAWQSIFHLVPIPGDHLRISNSTAPKEPKEGILIPFK